MSKKAKYAIHYKLQGQVHTDLITTLDIPIDDAVRMLARKHDVPVNDASYLQSEGDVPPLVISDVTIHPLAAENQ